MMIAGCARERCCFDLFRVFFPWDNSPPLRAEESLVSRESHRVRSFRKRLLKLLPRDEASNMGCVIAHENIFACQEIRQLSYWMREEKQTSPEHHQFRSLVFANELLDLLFCLINVDIPIVPVEGKVLNV